MKYPSFNLFYIIWRNIFLKFSSALFLTLLFYGMIPAQAVDTVWNKAYGGQMYMNSNMVQQTNSGGYIATGFIQPTGANAFYAWLINTDSNGDTLWTKSLGGGSINYYGTSVALSEDGQYIMAGYTYDFGADTTSAFITKISTNGNILWTRLYSNIKGGYVTSIQETSDGGFILTGNALPQGDNYSKIWLCKTDQNGNIVWSNTYNYDLGNSVKQTNDGGYIAVGRTIWAAHDSSWDACMIKTDANGNLVWENELGGNGISYDEAKDVQETSNGNFLVIGSTMDFNSAGFYDLWLFKLNSIGDTIWTKTFGGVHDDEGYSIQPTSDGNFILLGVTYSFSFGVDPDAWLIKVNSDGDEYWNQPIGYNHDDLGFSVKQTSDGGYIINGETSSFSQGGIWLSKVTPDVSSVDRSSPSLIKAYLLQQNYPNPFNPSTTINYSIPKSSNVKIEVYNLLGKKISTLVNEFKSAGSYKVKWNAENFSSGIYFYRIQAEGFSETKKMILLK